MTKTPKVSLFNKTHEVGAEQFGGEWYHCNRVAADAMDEGRCRRNDPRMMALVSLVVLRILQYQKGRERDATADSSALLAEAEAALQKLTIRGCSCVHSRELSWHSEKCPIPDAEAVLSRIRAAQGKGKA
jgi:hypothetical protein